MTPSPIITGAIPTMGHHGIGVTPLLHGISTGPGVHLGAGVGDHHGPGVRHGAGDGGHHGLGVPHGTGDGGHHGRP